MTNEELLSRGVEEIVVRRSLEAKLAQRRTLKIKHGVDPTTQNLHLGYAVVYEKLRQFQARGHIIQFLIGGFTARFGDPTDRSERRPLRPKTEVESLARGYIAQLSKILDISLIELRSNSEWYDSMTAENILNLLSSTSVQRMLERDMFQARLKRGTEIGLHEIAYPLLQGYDSVKLGSDATVIGRDQKFNELQARPLQIAAGQAPQDLVIMPLLVGTDGKRKMSQSYGNSINFNDAPNDMYGKIMSISDTEIINYFTLVTRLPQKDIKEIEQSIKRGGNPRDAKAKLALEITSIYHSKNQAIKAENYFNTVFRDRKTPSEHRRLWYDTEPKLIDVVVGSEEKHLSKSEAKRLLKQGAVEVDGKVIKDAEAKVPIYGIVKVGKRRFVRIDTYKNTK